MLQIYRAHTINEHGESTCKDKRPANDRGWSRCNCPIRVDGRLGSVRIRKACHTTVWSEAERIVAAAEAAGGWLLEDDKPQATPEKGSNIDSVIDEYCEYKQSDKAPTRIGPTSVFHLHSLLGHPHAPTGKTRPRSAITLKVYCSQNGIRHISQINTQHLLRWIGQWKSGRVQTALRIGRVKDLFLYSKERGYITKDPAADLKKPRLTRKDQKQRLPFTDAEIEKLIDCALALPRNGNGVVVTNAEIEAVILLMVWTGAGLSDATNFNLNAATDHGNHMDWAFTRIKNGAHVDTSIPPHVAHKLRNLPGYGNGYLFYRGGDATRQRTATWQHVLDQVFDLARIEHGASGTHRFRHTFAHRFLRSDKRAGGMYELSKLLGHHSVATTEKYYAAYVPEIAERMRVAVQSIW